MATRDILLGAPHAYLITSQCVLNAPLFSDEPLRSGIAPLIETLRLAFAVRLHAFAVEPAALSLVVQHPPPAAGDELRLRERWTACGGTARIPIDRLRARLGSLSCFVQTLLQRAARLRNRTVGGRGSIFTARYRACLLADDAAVLAATTWVEARTPDALATSRDQAAGSGLVRLATPPLRVGPDGQWYAADDGPTSLPPPGDQERAQVLARLADDLARDLPHYDHALRRGLALGRPESLTAPLHRLGRSGGRGRRRQLRDLGDALGLCGVWG
jgi:hypothetical protein